MIRSPAGALSRWSFIPASLALIVSMVVAPAARGQVAAPAPAPTPDGATPAAATTPPAPPAPAAGAGAAPAPGTPGALPPIGTIPAATKAIAASAALKPQIPAIQGFVAAAVTNLVSAPPAQQARARNALINEAMVNGLPNATPTYLDAYAQAVNTQLLPLAQHPSPRVRLNAAIVTADVARISNNIELAPAALAFMNDKSEAVVLWGMKAARWIIPAQLRVPVGGFNKNLADAIVPAVQKHSKGHVAGAIVTEAYDALTLDVLDQQMFAKVMPQQVAQIAPYVLALLQSRVALYQKGVPPAPTADATGTRFLTDPKTWPTLGQQQVAAVQAMSDVIALAAQQAQTANAGDRIELALLVRQAGLAAATLAPAAQGTAIQQAANYNPAQATPQQVAAVAEGVKAGLKATPQFANLKPAPAIVGNAPAPPPASAPTTGNVLIPGASTSQPTAGGAPPGGVGVPPGTTPAAPGGAAPKPPAPKAPGAGNGAGATKPPPAGNGPRPTPPAKNGPADKTGPTGGAGTGNGTGNGAGTGTGAGAGGGTTPPKPAR